MSNILIVGNVYKDVYLRLDERQNHFERDTDSDWLDLQFNGSTYPFFRRTSIYSGAAVALEICSHFDLQAHISGNELQMKQGQLTHHGAPDTYRYLLCRESTSAIIPSSQQPPTRWQTPDERAHWIFVDRSAVLTHHLVQAIQQYLQANSSTRLVVCANKYFPEIGRPLLDQASLIFTDDPYLLPPNTRKQVCIISDHILRFDQCVQTWHSQRLSLMTHATAYSVIATTVFAAFLQGYSPQKALLFAKINIENTTLNGSLSQQHLISLYQKEQLGHINLHMLAASLFAPNKKILAVTKPITDLDEHLSGVILDNNDQNDITHLISHGIIPGIRIDQGLTNFSNSEETYPLGIENLPKQLDQYYDQGIRFAKWQAVLKLSEITPTILAIEKNCDLLARYAKMCQHAYLVPIVEIQIARDANCTTKQYDTTAERVLDCLLSRMQAIGVDLEACGIIFTRI